MHQSDEETINPSQEIINGGRNNHNAPNTEMSSFLDSWTEESLNSPPLINEAIGTLSITNNEILSFPERLNIKSTNYFQPDTRIHKRPNNERTSLLDTPITKPIQEIKKTRTSPDNGSPGISLLTDTYNNTVISNSLLVYSKNN